MPTTERPEAHALDLIAGADPARPLDAVFVNAPLRDYAKRPRVNDYTLPVLGMAYIATVARQAGHNVGLLDAEAHGLGIARTAAIVNTARPRWAGFNLLAPTYRISATIAGALDPDIKIMAGGHHAKAAPQTVLTDPAFARLTALIIGEGETRVAALLKDHTRRTSLPQVMWRDHRLGTTAAGIHHGSLVPWTAPDVNTPSTTAKAAARPTASASSSKRRSGRTSRSTGSPTSACACSGSPSMTSPRI